MSAQSSTAKRSSHRTPRKHKNKASLKSHSWPQNLNVLSTPNTLQQTPHNQHFPTNARCKHHSLPAPISATSSVVPLENSWCFWYDKYPGPNLSPEQYRDALLSLGDFDTVQGFWSYYNNLPPASDINVSCSMHLMKRGILPLWEDANNVQGGHLTFKVSQDDVDFIWRQLTLSVIGEQYHNILAGSDDICGVSVSLRPKHEAVVSVWNRNASLIDTKSFSTLISSVIPDVRLDNFSYRVHA